MREGGCLQSRVNLRDDRVSSVTPPGPTLLIRRSRNTHVLLYPVRLFHPLNEKPGPEMPSNMTMKRPNPRIIRFVRNDQMSARRTHKDISSRGVVGTDDSSVPRAVALRYEPHVVSVEVHGVSNGDGILDVVHDKLVGVVAGGDGVRVVFCWEIQGRIGLRVLCEEEGWFVVIGAVRDAVDGPKPVPRGILNEFNLKVIHLRHLTRSGRRGRVIWDKG